MANEFFQRGRINVDYQYQLAKSLLQRLELDIDPHTPLGSLGIGHQQLVEIARALAKDTRVLIMDEPTSALSQAEVRTLFRVIADLKKRGVTIIYISHRLEELMEIGDRITVFRDGRFVAAEPVCNVSIPWIIEKMVGEKSKHFDYCAAEQGDEVLKVEQLTLPRENGGYCLNDVSFSLRKGEVIGIYGLLGAGRTELFKVINGVMRQTAGRILLNGKSVERLGFRQRMALGMALVPEDRQAEGLVQMMSIKANMTLASLGRNALRPLAAAGECALVDGMIEKLAIKVSDRELPITSLSGGNQQKVVLGKALLTVAAGGVSR